MTTEINIGENIKKLRTKTGLSQEDFAKNLQDRLCKTRIRL